MVVEEIAWKEFSAVNQGFQGLEDGDAQTMEEIDSFTRSGDETLGAGRAQESRSLLTSDEGIGGNADRTTSVSGQGGINTANTVDVTRSIKEPWQEITERAPGVFESLDRQVAAARIENIEHANKFEKFVSVVKERMERVGNLVETLAKKPDLTQGDLMHIQYEIMEMGIVLDVASKVGDKGSQLLQTLFRGQN
jgi:hypothetical protein